jgi:hypothetical protein
MTVQHKHAAHAPQAPARQASVVLRSPPAPAAAAAEAEDEAALLTMIVGCSLAGAGCAGLIITTGCCGVGTACHWPSGSWINWYCG